MLCMEYNGIDPRTCQLNNQRVSIQISQEHDLESEKGKVGEEKGE